MSRELRLVVREESPAFSCSTAFARASSSALRFTSSSGPQKSIAGASNIMFGPEACGPAPASLRGMHASDVNVVGSRHRRDWRLFGVSVTERMALGVSAFLVLIVVVLLFLFLFLFFSF